MSSKTPMTSTARTTSEGDTSSREDYFSTLPGLPPELLLKIISEASITSFLDLAQASKSFRHFIKANASRICNAAIQCQFPLQTAFMPTRRIDGWLVPTHINVFRVEIWACNWFYSRYSSCNGQQECHLDLLVNITEPEPQYLFWLQGEPVTVSQSQGDKERHVASNRLMQTYLCLSALNEKLMKVGVNWGKPPKGLRQREMIWYYGIPEE